MPIIRCIPIAVGACYRADGHHHHGAPRGRRSKLENGNSAFLPTLSTFGKERWNTVEMSKEVDVPNPNRKFWEIMSYVIDNWHVLLLILGQFWPVWFGHFWLRTYCAEKPKNHVSQSISKRAAKECFSRIRVSRTTWGNISYMVAMYSFSTFSAIKTL